MSKTCFIYDLFSGECLGSLIQGFEVEREIIKSFSEMVMGGGRRFEASNYTPKNQQATPAA